MSLFAQAKAMNYESVYQHSANNSFVFEYSASFTGGKTINNFFIKEIAKYNVSSLERTKFMLHYSLIEKIDKISPYTYKASVSVEIGKCTGDIYYKGFDISDILHPEMMDFSIIIDDNGNYIEIKEFTDLKKVKGNTFNAEFEFDALNDHKNFKLYVSDISFYSQENDKERFYKRITQIDNYYAGISAMDESIERFNQMNFSPAMIVKSFFQLQEYWRVFENISNSEFIKELQLSPENNSEFFEKKNVFDRKLNEYTRKYNNRLETLDYLYFSEDFSGLALDFVHEINYFSMISDKRTHTSQSYFYNLGMVEYSENEVSEIENGMINILSRTKFKKDTRTIVHLFYKKVLSTYIEESDALIRNEEYRLARGLLENAKRFVAAFIEDESTSKLNRQLSKANYGIYNSYLHLIDRAIEIGNYELADSYINKAKKFQIENKASIISDQSVKDVSEKLVKLYINKGFNLIKNEEYFESNYCFEKAHEKCQEIGIYNHDYVIKHGLVESRNGLYKEFVFKAQKELANNNLDLARKYLDKAQSLMKSYPSQIVELKEFYEIKSELLQQAYLNYIQKGRFYLENGNYRLSYLELLDALNLEENSEVLSNQMFTELFEEAASKYLVGQCEHGEVKVKKRELKEARVIYENCLDLQREFGLSRNQLLMDGLAQLKSNILAEQCHIAAENLDEHLLEVENLVVGGEFISANKILEKASQIMESNRYCDLDFSQLYTYNEFIPFAAEYQKLAIEAQSSLENNNADHLLNVFEKMEILSQRHGYIRNNIEPKPLYYLFAVKKNLAFLETSMQQYNADNELLAAVRIMNVIEAASVSVKDTRPIQVSLGEKLAAADKIHPESDPAEKVKEYTNGNTYYKYLKKAYLQSWNNEDQIN